MNIFCLEGSNFFPPPMSDGASSSNASSIRAQLRDLKDNVDKHRTEYASTGSSALAGVIDKANSLWQRGAKDDSRAGALDASLLNVTSGIGAEQAGNLDKATPTAFLHKLLMKYKFSTGNAIKWAELASDVAMERIHKQVPAVTFLLGKFEAPAKKEKKERKRKEQGPSEPLQTADNVDVAGLREVEEDKAQTARLRVLANALREAAVAAKADGRERRVNMFHLLLNPDSFSQTVENFFDLAFLVKDGWVQVMCDDQCAWLCDATPPVTDDYQGGLHRIQNILKLDHPTYKRLCAKWCTPDAPQLLPKRATAAHDQPAAAAGDTQAAGKKARTE